MIYTILGTKGGVGKSSVAIGVSIWLSKLGKKVLLVDGDPHVRSVELKLAPGMEMSLSKILRGEISWKEAVYRCSLKQDGKILYPNLAVMPAGSSFLPPGAEQLEEYASKMDEILEKAARKFSHVLIDTPASVSNEHLLLTSVADQVIHVCEPNDDSILATEATEKGLRTLFELSSRGVILSRVPGRVKVESWKRKAEKIAPVLGVVPFDPKLDDAFRQNLPVDVLYPSSAANLSFRRIALVLSRENGGGHPRGRERIAKASGKILEIVRSS